MKRFIAIAFVAALAACGPAAAPTTAPAAAAATATGREARVPGMPPTDRVWVPGDFQAAFAALNVIPLSQLPRTSTSSPTLIEHLTDPAALEPCLDQSTPLNARFPVCLELTDASNRILRLYAAVQQTDVSYSEEVIRMLGFSLRMTAVMHRLIDELMPTLDRADPTYSTRMQGLEQARRGVTQIIQGSITTLTLDRRAYADNSAARFASILAETYPVISSDLPADTRSLFEDSLDRIGREDRSPAVRAALSHYAVTPVPH